ncbi:MAG: hypothetical protein ABI537_10645 [Casimicrobiaceae bacterium]
MRAFFDWIGANSHWIFDGFGVAIVITVIGWITGLFSYLHKKLFPPPAPQHQFFFVGAPASQSIVPESNTTIDPPETLKGVATMG